MLPFDYSRCLPGTPSLKCKECARWANHPEQTYGHWTPIQSIESPLSESCRFIHEDYWKKGMKER